MVDKNSAVLGLEYSREDAIPVPESNHSTICKFDSRTPNYELVISGIVDLVDWTLKEDLSPNGSSNTLPPSLATSIIDDVDDSSSSLSAPHRSTQVSYAYLPDFGDINIPNSDGPEHQPPFAGPFYLWPIITVE